MVQTFCLSLVLLRIKAISTAAETQIQSARIANRYRKIIVFIIKILTFNFIYHPEKTIEHGINGALTLLY